MKVVYCTVLVILEVLVPMVNCQRIKELQVKTSTQENANMDGDGQIGFVMVNKRFETCSIETLDNTALNDFERGHLNAFWGPMLADCNNFELPDGEIPVFRANHRGEDALMMEYVRLLLSDGTYLECPVNVMLDNSDSMSLQCHRPGEGTNNGDATILSDLEQFDFDLRRGNTYGTTS